MELFPSKEYRPTSTLKPLDERIYEGALKALQEGFGFGLGIHNVTPSEYAEVLKHLRPTTFDAESELSTSSTPVSLEEKYLGKKMVGRLVRLTDGNRKNTCEILDSLILAHQFILSKICKNLCCSSDGTTSEEDGRSVPVLETWSFCHHCVILPALARMQDFLRMVVAPVGSVVVGYDRSTIYSRGELFPSKQLKLDEYCWRKSIVMGNGLQNQTSYLILTLFPSLSEGLVSESIEKVAINVTVTEEVIRGQTAAKGSKGRYYEWVAPVIVGVRSKKVQTFSLAVGCSLILPSTYVIRLGAHPSQEVVVFIHCVRVKLPNGEQKPFLIRPKSSVRADLHEYGNQTEVHHPHFMKGQDRVDLVRLCGLRNSKEHSTFGTIPSFVNVPINTRFRENIADSFYNVKLGSGRVHEAFRRTPYVKIQIPTAAAWAMDAEDDGVQWMCSLDTERLMIDDIPYGDFQYLTWEPLVFSVSAGVLPNHRMKRHRTSDAMDEDNITDSSTYSGAENGDEDHSDEYTFSEGASTSEEGSNSERLIYI